MYSRFSVQKLNSIQKMKNSESQAPANEQVNQNADTLRVRTSETKAEAEIIIEKKEITSDFHAVTTSGYRLVFIRKQKNMAFEEFKTPWMSSDRLIQLSVLLYFTRPCFVHWDRQKIGSLTRITYLTPNNI
jgi:hypothetical protein